MIQPYSQMPVEIPWSANTDKNGNATHTENLGKDGWYNLAVSGLTSGNAYWTVSRNLSFLRPGYGSQIHMPIGITAPGSRLDIAISGGPANAVVSGLIYGQKASRPQLLTDVGGIDDYATNTQLGTGQTLLGTIQTPGDGLPHILTFPVQSSSTQAVGWSFSLSGNNLPPVSLKMTGDVTKANAVQINVQSQFTFASGIGRWQLPDQNVTCTVTDDGTHPSLTFFYAYNFEPIMNVRVGAGDPLLPVSLASAGPAPWQAAATGVTGSGTINGGANVAILTPQANLQYYLHTALIATGTAAGAFAGLTDSFNNQLVFGTTNVPNTVLYYDFKGRGLGNNVGVNVNNFGGAAESLFWTLTYTLAV